MTNYNQCFHPFGALYKRNRSHRARSANSVTQERSHSAKSAFTGSQERSHSAFTGSQEHSRNQVYRPNSAFAGSQEHTGNRIYRPNSAFTGAQECEGYRGYRAQSAFTGTQEYERDRIYRAKSAFSEEQEYAENRRSHGRAKSACVRTLQENAGRNYIESGLRINGTADPEYIRAVSVKYKRCPSSYSTRSAVSVTAPCQVKPLQQELINRPKTAVAMEMVPPCARPHTAHAERERTEMLEELLFFYGRSVHQSFSFTSPWRAPFEDQTRSSSHLSRTSTSGTWECKNEALRQMSKASHRHPRHRFFPGSKPPHLDAKFTVTSPR